MSLFGAETCETDGGGGLNTGAHHLLQLRDDRSSLSNKSIVFDQSSRLGWNKVRVAAAAVQRWVGSRAGDRRALHR